MEGGIWFLSLLVLLEVVVKKKNRSSSICLLRAFTLSTTTARKRIIGARWPRRVLTGGEGINPVIQRCHVRFTASREEADRTETALLMVLRAERFYENVHPAFTSYFSIFYAQGIAWKSSRNFFLRKRAPIFRWKHEAVKHLASARETFIYNLRIYLPFICSTSGKYLYRIAVLIFWIYLYFKYRM